jgi:DNA-K related protein
VPLYGPANTVVRKEAAERWARVLLGRSFASGRESADAIFALGQLARVASDRTRDLDEALRHEVLARLTELGADETTLRPVREYHELETAQQVQALGDSLPIGLRLLNDATAPGDSGNA